MDGKLSGSHIRKDPRQGQEQHHGRESHQEIGQRQLVAQAPEHVFPHQPPEQWKHNGDQRDSDEELQEAEEGPEASGNLPCEEEDAEPGAKPEGRPGKTGRQPCPEPGAGLRLG